MWRGLGISFALVLAGCNTEVYVHNGVTDGDTFTLAPRALMDSDPVLQSWVAYSLTRSTCKLQSGSSNPARASSFECERLAREHLADRWGDYQIDDPLLADEYLDALLQVRRAGYLEAYVARYLAERAWSIPQIDEASEFDEWQRSHLPGHKAQTRLIGSWSYATRGEPQ